MRRMITNKQVVEVVNKAIDDGEIEVGGLPEIEEGDAGKVLKVNEQEDGVEWAEAGGADNALVLPESAPASQQLVGINTSNEQNSLGIGDGLQVVNGELQANNTFIFEATISGSSTSTQSLTLTAEERAFIVANKPLLKIKFNDCTILYNCNGYDGTDYISFKINSSTSYSLNTMLNSSGQTLKSQEAFYYIGKVQTGNSITFTTQYCYLMTGTPSTIAVATRVLDNINSGDTITNNAIKTTIQNSGCLKINNHVAYQMYRDTANNMSYYYNVVSSSGSLVQTVYEINESTWVITFVTKTIN